MSGKKEANKIALAKVIYHLTSLINHITKNKVSTSFCVKLI